jgi:hypothetical protein
MAIGGGALRIKIFRSMTGMGMTELMVGVGLAGVIGLGVAQLYKGGDSSSIGTHYKLEMAELVQHISQVLKSEAVCTSNFKTMVAASTTGIPMIKDVNGNMIMDLSKKYGQSQVAVKSMELLDVAGTQDSAQVNPGRNGSTNFVITFMPKKGTSMENQNIKQVIRVAVLTDAAGKIMSCFSVGEGEENYWLRQQTNPDNIYYPGRNVGVGLESPTERLDVGGVIRVESEGGTKISLGGGGAGEFRVSAEGAIEFWNGENNERADLATKNIVAAEYVQLADTSLPCTPENHGAVYFIADKFLVCEGSTWIPKRVGVIDAGYGGPFKGGGTTFNPNYTDPDSKAYRHGDD